MGRTSNPELIHDIAYTQLVSSRKPLIWGVAALVAIVGGFVFWLQMGLLASIGALAWSGIGLQNHLANAADGLISGDYVGRASGVRASESQY